MMKRYLAAFALLAFILAGCKDNNPTPTPEPEPQPEPEVPVFAAPTNLNVETPDGISAVLTWENASTDYDGVEVQKAGPSGKYKMMGNVPAGVMVFTDKDFTENGKYSYRICTFKGNTYSDYAIVDFTIDGIPEPTPEISVTSISNEPNMLVINYTVTDDLGGSVKNGIVWTTDSTDPSLENGESFEYWKNLRNGAGGIGILLNPTCPVKVRAYAKSITEGTVGYSETIEVNPAQQPAPYNVSYEDITPSELPSEIKVYKAHTTVTGHPLNIWYSIADLSTGNVTLRTICTDSGKQKSSAMAKAQTESPYVFVNGGYFGGNASVSYVLDKGVQKAENESFLARKKSYYVSRGVFGVTSDAKSSVNWRFGRSVSGGPYFYDTPIPQIDGAPELSPSKNFPSPAIDPGYYSAIGGGPVLVKDGKIRINFVMLDDVYLSNFELFPSDIYNRSTRQPRTAIGCTADGKVVLMVVDGRNTGVSEGVILTDLASLMTGVGCVDVMNLDGGGSSVFCVGSDMTVLNRPTDGTERAVVSAVGFAKK